MQILTSTANYIEDMSYQFSQEIINSKDTSKTYDEACLLGDDLEEAFSKDNAQYMKNHEEKKDNPKELINQILEHSEEAGVRVAIYSSTITKLKESANPDIEMFTKLFESKINRLQVLEESKDKMVNIENMKEHVQNILTARENFLQSDKQKTTVDLGGVSVKMSKKN